jgi:hypothetical protein
MIRYLILALFLAMVVLSAVLNIRKRGWRPYVINLLIGIDQFFNAVLGGAPDETISSRCARGQSYWYWKVLGRILNAIQPNHIEIALAHEQAGAHQPEALR